MVEDARHVDRRTQTRGVAALRGVRARQARPQPRARRVAARRRRRDGAAPRPRRLHPAQRGRLDLGGPGRRHHRVAARTRRTRCSRRPATRSTGTRPSTRSPTTSPTCDADEPLRTPDPNDEHGSVYDGLLGTDTSQWAFGTDFEDPLAGVDTTVPEDVDAAELAAYCLRSATTRWSCRTGSRSGAATRRTSRRTSPWPTSPSTCSVRPGCCWPARPLRTLRGAGAAGGVAGPGRGRAGVLPRGPRVPQCPAGRDRERRLRHTIARLLLFATAGWRRSSGSSTTLTRCSPRSRPRA